MATERLRYVVVDSANTPGGDGTTNATAGANRAYASLSEAESAEQSAGANLVSADEYLKILCTAPDGSIDDTAVLFDGFTTDVRSDYYILIEGDNTTGVWSTGFYTLALAQTGNNQVLEINDPGVILRRLQVENTAPTVSNWDGAIGIYQADCEIDRCLAKGGRYPVSNLVSSGDTKIHRSIFYLPNSATDGGGFVNTGAGNVEAQDSIAIGSTRGWRAFGAGALTLRNCYGYGETNAYEENSGTISQTTCAANDTTATVVGLRNIPFDNTTFTEVSSGIEDFQLPNGSGLIDEGTDNSGESAPFNYTVDIAGTSLNSPREIGPFAAADTLTIVSINDGNPIVDGSSSTLIEWNGDASSTNSATILGTLQGNYTVNVGSNNVTRFDFVWPDVASTLYGKSLTFDVDSSYADSVTVIPSSGYSYVDLAGYVSTNEGVVVSSQALEDGDQLEFEIWDTESNSVSISAAGYPQWAVDSADDAGTFQFRVIDPADGDRSTWETISYLSTFSPDEMATTVAMDEASTLDNVWPDSIDGTVTMDAGFLTTGEINQNSMYSEVYMDGAVLTLVVSSVATLRNIDTDRIRLRG